MPAATGRRDEVDEAWSREPLIRLRQYLIDQGAWSDEREQELVKGMCGIRAGSPPDEYMDMVTNDPQPVTAMFDFMYEQLPHDLVEQRAYAEEFPEDGGHH